jgi:hypothetical protein
LRERAENSTKEVTQVESGVDGIDTVGDEFEVEDSICETIAGSCEIEIEGEREDASNEAKSVFFPR